MKNRINLYHPEFHPRLRLLSLLIVINTWILTAILCGIFYFYLAAKQQDTVTDLAKVEQHKQQQEILVRELQIAVDNMKVDPKLSKQVETSLQLISLKNRVLQQLSGQDELKSNSFSNLMIDLAAHNQTGLWLTHINLNGKSVVIEGAATDSAIVPKWLSSLGQTEYFKGQEFADTRLYRDAEQQLNFAITTGKPVVEQGANDE